jgi:hypothetical protein
VGSILTWTNAASSCEQHSGSLGSLGMTVRSGAPYLARLLVRYGTGRGRHSHQGFDVQLKR